MRRAFPLLLGLLPVLVLLDLLAVELGLTLPLRAHLILFMALAACAAVTGNRHGPRAALSGAAVFTLTGAVLLHFPYGDYKAVWRAAWEVAPGMERARVAAILEPHFSCDPAPWPHTAEPQRDFWFGDCGDLQEFTVFYDGDDRVERVERFFEGRSTLWARGHGQAAAQ